MNQTYCNEPHRYDSLFSSLPEDQSGQGRHRCAGCAYNKGYADGKARKTKIEIDLLELPLSQAGEVRHKSPIMAYAQGYIDGLRDSY